MRKWSCEKEPYPDPSLTHGVPLPLIARQEPRVANLVQCWTIELSPSYLRGLLARPLSKVSSLFPQQIVYSSTCGRRGMISPFGLTKLARGLISIGGDYTLTTVEWLYKVLLYYTCCSRAVCEGIRKLHGEECVYFNTVTSKTAVRTGLKERQS